MKHRSYKNTNLIGWIVIILGFSFLYFSYFFIYIPNQEARLKQRAFRILKEYGSNINDKHNYYKNHFNNYAPYYGIRHFGIHSVSDSSFSDSVEVSKVLQGLFPITTEYNAGESGKKPDSFQLDGNHMFLQFHNTIEKSDSIRIADFINTDSLSLLMNYGLLTSVPVEQFMSGLKFDRLFENIVLFADSQVYYNSNEDVLIDINNPEALNDSTSGLQGGTYLKLDIRGQDKHVMILPIQFIGKDFFLAGFLSETQFRHITRTINSQLLIFIAGLLLLVFVGMPVLKVIFLSSSERLSSIDGSSSVFSAVLGIGLLVLLTISFIKQQISDNLYSRNRIQRVSESLFANVKSDIDSIKKLYCSINDLALERKNTTGENSIAFTETEPSLMSFVECHMLRTKKILHDSALIKQFNAYDSILNLNSRFLQHANLNSPFPLNEILLINNSGKISKAITSTPFSDVVEIDLSERNYFLNVKDTGSAWVSNNNYKYYIESIQSYNTGKGETAVSFHTTAFDSTVPVLAITSVIPSLYYQVVPKDVEFLIINGEGNVLYHSIKSKNLHENFLEESESDYRLAKAIDLRTEDKFQLDYNGKKWLARIIPFEDTPLFHITLIDQSPVNNINARVFLFSFYFFVVSIFLLVMGILIKRWIFPSREKHQYMWFLNWLNFDDDNFSRYKSLIVLLMMAIVLQVAGMFILKNPLAALFYQVFFMVYVIYISMLVLKNKEIKRNNFIYGIVFITCILLIQILLSGPMGLLKKLLFLVIVFLITISVTYSLFLRLKDERAGGEPASKAKQNYYLLYLFLLLANLSVVPVMQFYFSVKNTENRLWQQEQMFDVAEGNLALQTQYKDHEAAWFKKIQGNNIDYLKVSYTQQHPDSADNYRVTNSDRIYSNLFDPITKGYYPLEWFKGRNYTAEWELGDSIIFTKAGREGGVKVAFDGKSGGNYFLLGFVVLIACILVLGLIWLLLNYLASVIFNLHPEKVPPSDNTWKAVVTNPGNKRILLKAFNGDCYFRKSAAYFYGDPDKSVTRKKNSVRQPVFISQILDGEVKLQDVLKSQPVLWLSGLDNYIYQIDKHESLLSILMQLNRNSEQKVVVDLPFDVELINEYYDEYISENELEPEFAARLFGLRKRWNHVFRNYIEYNGYIDFVMHEKAKKEASVQDMVKVDIDDCIEELRANPESWYNVIWANLTGKEKIILYDLADDGLLNRKNKPIIKRLMEKKLIIAKGNLKLFSGGFRDFVLKQLTPSKIKSIERDLGLKGQWSNIRYLILLFLIPLAAFIFMSQGISMEKIFGLIGGALAAITGLLRLFDSSPFKQAGS